MYQDDLEQFLQEEVKQHRMYPSDHVWKNIRTELHGNKSWPALTFISLFIITALTISTLLNNHPALQTPGSKTQVIVKQRAASIPLTAVTDDNTSDKNYFEKIAPEQITAETFADLNENRILPEEPVVAFTQPLVSLQTTPVGSQLKSFTDKAVTSQYIPVTQQRDLTDVAGIAGVLTPKEEPPVTSQATATPTIPDANNNSTRLVKERMDVHPSADDFLKDFTYVQQATPRRNSKFGFQFYITPSTSYRRLSDEKVKDVVQPAVAASVSNSIPQSLDYASSASVNNVVRHRPAIGIEAGFGVLYNMSSHLKFKTGIQLNVRQYYIQTYESLTNDLASLSLINHRGVETINFYSSYNNNTGYKQTQLDNKVYQVSIPVGIVWDVIDGKHFGINTEASVQPTMTLNNKTYLLSTDYKHYTDGNDFIRKWNINTSLGLNLTYKAGSTSWQLGPQIRYQHLPTYSNVYPIKEYLMDYGLRLGFTRQIR